MKALARIFTLVLMFSLLMSGCGAAPAVSPTLVQPPTPFSTDTPLPDPSSTPTVAQSQATELPPGFLAIVPVAAGPITLAASSDSIWVEAHRANIVTRIDPLQNKEVARLKDAPVHCKVVSGGGFVWAAEAHSGGGPNPQEGKVTKIDPASGAVLGSIDLVTACGIAADDSDVWVTSPMDSKVVRYNTASLEERAIVPLGRDVFEMVIGPDAVWAAGEAGGGTVWRIDPATNQVVASINISDSEPVGLIAAFGSVWVGSRSRGFVYRIDPATNEVAETIPVNHGIGGIGAGPDAIWASGFSDGKIYRIDPQTNSVSGSLSTHFSGLGPPLVAFESLWVAALDENVVLRLDPAAFDGTVGAMPSSPRLQARN